MRRTWRKMCFCLIVLAATLALGGNGFPAEPVSQDDQAVAGIVAVMARDLKLTDAQIKQVASVVKEYFRRVEEAKAEGIVGAGLQREIKVLREEMDMDLEHYLTDGQMTLWRHPTAQAKESAGNVAGDRDSVLSGYKRGSSSTGSRSLRDNGVLQSGSTNSTKTSGVW